MKNWNFPDEDGLDGYCYPIDPHFARLSQPSLLQPPLHLFNAEFRPDTPLRVTPCLPSDDSAFTSIPLPPISEKDR